MAAGKAMHARFAIVRTEPDDAMALMPVVDDVTGALAAAEGVVAAKRFFCAEFTEEVQVGDPDLGIFAVTAWSDDTEALAKAWADATRPLFDAAPVRESFELLAEPARVSGNGWGFDVPTEGVARLAASEPMLAIISGTLLPEYQEPFQAAAVLAIRQAHADPDYLGGCGMTETLMETISFSCWRSAGAARRFAFGAGAHKEAKDADEDGGWHDRSTDFFVALRPLTATGSLLGANPFAGLVPEV